MSGLHFLILSLLQLPFLGGSVKVSFFGDGYITMPLQEAKVSTNIRIKFKTQQSNSLLFLAAGRTDYCLIKLENSNIDLTYKVEKNVEQLTLPFTQNLNDFEWHDIALQRFDNNITLQVDGKILPRTLPKSMATFNVHFGVFLGGVGDFPADYLNDLVGFRGCMSDVYYNNINIIKRAKEKTGHTASVGVQWFCSNEFEGSTTDSISFLKNDSFALMMKDSNSSGESLLFYFRTIEEYGLLFFNGGYDFMMIEIEKQHIKVSFNKDGSLVQLESIEDISDGAWHRVLVRYKASIVELLLDDVSYTGTHSNSTKEFINLERSVFFGGVQENMRRRLLNKGLRINEISFKGCLRDIRINNVQLGFPQIKVSNKLAVNCTWKYPCLEFDPCLKSGTCKQHGVDEFLCSCDQSFCIKADFLGPYKIFTKTNPEIEILHVSPLQLIEGGTVFLSSQFIEVLIDKRSFPAIFDSSIIFHVVQRPKHGKLLQFSQEQHFIQSNSFSYKDLLTDKVKYIHNGLEYFNDHAALDIQISGDANEIPHYILGKHRFILHMNITPINDPPLLQVPENRILRVVEGIEKTIDADFFNIVDPDSPAKMLIYTIIPHKNTKKMLGVFLVNKNPATTFSQADVNKGNVAFLYNSTNGEAFTYDILLRVSDGIETSDNVYLPISVRPLVLSLVNNTGIIMVHKSSSLITPSNLSIETNTNEDIDIKYEIVKQPQYGSVQKLRPVDSAWVNVDWFTDTQLILGHIRYIHNNDFPWQDEFKFIASFGFASTQVLDFRITFTRLRISSRGPRNVLLNGVQELVFSDELLLHGTEPIETFSRNIIYTITQSTKYGSLFIEGSRKNAKEMDSFTQSDIDKRRLRYKTHRSCYSNFTDILEYKVSVSECDDVAGRLLIEFLPLKELTSQLKLQNRKSLVVEEGDRCLITTNHFQISLDTFENIYFFLSNPPKHGSLCRYDGLEMKIKPITEFTIRQLIYNEINYCHDDTESTIDNFDLLLLSNNHSDFEYVESFKVQIQLKNDNAPNRDFERIFHVVRNGFRTLSADVLQYSDADTDSHPWNIHYIHVSSTNGAFYKLDKNINAFTQDEIKNHLIMYRHEGPDVGIASFIVTDHQYEVNGFMEILASDPFVSIISNNATIVQEGKFVILRSKDLIFETNLDMKSEEVYYEIIRPASYGRLLYLGRSKYVNDSSFMQYNISNSISLTNFTLMDVESDCLVYWNTETASTDRIRYRVRIRNISAEGEVIFRIYPSAYYEPLQVKANGTLYVEESTSVLLSRDILEVVHSNISPNDITFLVTSSPLHGYLEMTSMSADDDYNCKVFDQAAINAEKLFYIQAGVNQSRDYFIFDVTNGITWLRNLMLKIIIIPEKLYMHTNTISVVEGKSVQLSSLDMLPASEYFVGKILEFNIVNPPSSGYVMAANAKVKRFTQKQLDKGSIYYVHNGNEILTDSMTLIASARTKESVPYELRFEIIPVNDEKPVVVTNTGLQVWDGGRYVIKNTDLLVQDYDTFPENLTFFVHHTHGGFIVKAQQPLIKINRFTQAQINDEQIIFVHESGSKHNEIKFTVTDGQFSTSEQTLNIYIKPIEILRLRNEKLHIFPLTKKQISRDNLHYKCSDEYREVYYNITKIPRLGRMLRENKEEDDWNNVFEFNQSDIDNGRIFYEHTTATLDFRITDSFNFDVFVRNSTYIYDQEFNIEISVSSGGLQRFLSLSKLHVDEGGSAPIMLNFSDILDYLSTKAGIYHPEIHIKLNKNPDHGNITLGKETPATTVFYPADFFNKKVYYIHDDSDTIEDEIWMSLYLIQGILLCDFTIPVAINPINDQPFTLVTYSPKMIVVEGENKTITPNMLFTEDKDTPPEDIVYIVMNGPTLGALKKISNDGYPLDILSFSNQFTQADINNNRIVYVHFGSPQSTSFCFTVSDQQFSPAYEIFMIQVEPIYILPFASNTPISVQQGSTSAFIKMKNIGVATNANSARLSYNITNSPLYGIIILKHQPTLHFTQNDLEKGNVNYMQTDWNHYNDTFQVSVYVPNTNYATTVDLVVNVEPVIMISDILMGQSPEKIKLEPILVNENSLSLKLNKFNPKFIVTKAPTTGQICKVIRSTRFSPESQIERSVNAFSYKELRSGIVYFVPSKTSIDAGKENDFFEYQLEIKTIQPAQARVKIEYPRPAGIDLDESKIFFTKYKIITSIIIVIITLILCMVLLTKQGYLKRFQKQKLSKKTPCPPDLTSVNPQHSQHPDECDNTDSSITTSLSKLPQCKIIAMVYNKQDLIDSDPESNNQPNSQMILSRCYQLENVSWDSCENENECNGNPAVSQSDLLLKSQPSVTATNQLLLRRNQYWV